MKSKAVSRTMLTLLLMSMLTLAFNVQPVRASGTIYIRPDGTVEGTDKIQRDGDVYTFTDNIYDIDMIRVERSDIIVDGNRYTLQGSGAIQSMGFHVYSVNNVTIKNINIKNFSVGVHLSSISYSTVYGTNITSNRCGIILRGSNNAISGNNITANTLRGIGLRGSHNVFRNNIVVGSDYNFGVEGSTLSEFINDVDESNTVDGKPIHYLVNRRDVEIPSDAGYVGLVNSTNITVEGLELKHNYQGILLAYTTSSKITNNEITNNADGIELFDSSTNIFYGNNITENTLEGVWLQHSSNNSFSDNNITNNRDGIGLYESSNNTVSGNNIVNNNEIGVLFFCLCHNNTVSENDITNNARGIELMEWSNNNIFSGNNVINNNQGVNLFFFSSSNKFYHNNFIDNIQQVYIDTVSANFWDDGYPSGGNYWSDHVTVDDCCGINQDEPGSDGIVDEPYIIDDYNRDNYPLVKPWSPVISATIDIDPDTLNLKSKGEWITCYIELPEGYDVSDIDIYSIMLSDTIPVSLLVNPPVPVPAEIGDYDNDTIPDLMVKFNRTEVASWIYNDLGIEYGNVTLTITGEVDGTPFEGTDTVKVLFPGDVDDDGDVDPDDLYPFAGAYGTRLGDAAYNGDADFNEDGSIDPDDLYILAGNYGKTAV